MIWSTLWDSASRETVYHWRMPKIAEMESILFWSSIWLVFKSYFHKTTGRQPIIMVRGDIAFCMSTAQVATDHIQKVSQAPEWKKQIFHILEATSNDLLQRLSIFRCRPNKSPRKIP